MDPEVTQELEEQLRELNQTLSQLNGIMSDRTKDIAATTNTIQQNKNAEQTNKQSTEQNSQAQTKLSEADKAASEALTKASQNFSSALENGKQALGSFTDALFSSQEGMAKYGKAAESAGKAVSDIGQNFGILGKATGGLIAIFGKLVGEVFKLNDNIINLRDSFTKAAGILPTTASNLGELAKQARFSLDDMQKLSKATNKLGQNLLGLGGYAGQGAVKFMEMANVSDDVRKQFGRLGVSQEQLLDLQSKYVEMQGVSGQSMANQSKSSDQLRKESIAYAENLIKMSSLTGESVEKLQAERNTAMMEFEEQVQIAAENKKIADLRKAGRNDEADAIAQEQANRKELITKYTDLYGKEAGQQAGRLMRTGAYDDKTAGLAMRDPDFMGFVEQLKTSKNATGDIIKQADKTSKSYDEAAIKYGKAMQYAGEELGKQVGVGKEAITRRNKYGDDITKTLETISKDMDVKKQAGTDPLADSIEGFRSFEREAKAGLQSFLESIDPMRMGFDTLKKIGLAAAVALGAVAAILVLPKVLKGAKAVVEGVKSVGSGISKGFSAFKSLFTKQKSLPSASSIGGAAKNATSSISQGSGESATLTKVTNAADKPGASKAEKMLTAIVRGFEFLDKVGKNMVQGAVYAGGAITAIGGVIAALEVVMEDQLPYYAKKLTIYEKLDGPKIEAIGKAMAGLGAGVLAAGGGKIADSISNVIDWFMGAEDPMPTFMRHIVKFQEPNLNVIKVENNAQAIVTFSKAMATMAAKSAGGSLAGVSKSLADGISSYFKVKPPVEQVKDFSYLKLNVKKTKNNATAFVAFSEAIGTYKGFGSPTAAISTALATAAYKYFKAQPPLDQFKYFTQINIDGKKTTRDANAFVDFATAMSQYKAGPGLLDSIGSWISSNIFNEEGPVDRFRKFSKEDFGKTPTEQAKNFQTYADTVRSQGEGSYTANGSPSSNTSGDTGSGVTGTIAKLGAAGVRAVGSAADATREAVTGAVGWVGEKLGLSGGGQLNFGTLKARNAFIIHHTAGRGTAEQVMATFKQRDLGTQYIIDRNGKIFQALAPGSKGRHIKNGTGVGKGLNNSNTEGVEVIAKDDTDILPVQVEAAKRLVAKLGYSPRQVYGHGEINAHKMRTEGNTITRAIAGGSLRSPVAKKGGMFSGPMTGYPIELHGTEMVVPVTSNSILVKIASTTSKVSTNKTKTSKTSTSNVTKTGGKVDHRAINNLELYGIVSARLDHMISVLESSNDTHGQRLLHSMV